MQKWEYQLVYLDYEKDRIIVSSVNDQDVSKNKWDIHSYLNRIGEEGWELVTNPNWRQYVLKRPKL